MMRAVFIGAGAVAVMCAHILLRRGHEVVIIERSKERIEHLADELDCGFIHGDGGTPAILRESDPDRTDFLFCLTGNDQTNIIASLVGRSLGFARVVTKIENPEFDHICIELGLEDTIVPARTIGRYLADMFIGSDPLDLSALIKDEARVFSFIVRQEDAGNLDELDLPEHSRVICYYREGRFRLPGDDAKLLAGDEVVLVSHSRNLPALKERWAPHPQPV